MRNAAAAAAAFIVPAAAFADGYAIPNTNARDLGMAESVVADQHGPSAVFGNSAALAGMEGLGITAGVQGIYFRSTWSGTTGALGSTDTLKKLVTPPELYVAYGSKFNDMAYGVGAGFTVVGGGFVFWPDDWQGRTRVFVVDRKVYNFIISGGIEPVKGVKLGLGGVYFRTTQPHRERLGKVLVGMLLRVPPGDVPHEAAREGNRLVAVDVGPIERSEQVEPLLRLVELVRVVERVPRFVAEVRQDLALVLEIVQGALERLQLGIGEIERDADDRLAVRAGPLVAQVAGGAEGLQALGRQLAVELLDVLLHHRALELEPELPDGAGEQLARFGRRMLERRHTLEAGDGRGE
jgi:hypothetical protein